MDPYEVLELPSGAAPEHVTAAYRELAKRWHPDRASGPEAERRMAEINAAYDLLRAAAWMERRDPIPAPPRTPERGAWLAPPIPRAPRHQLPPRLPPHQKGW